MLISLLLTLHKGGRKSYVIYWLCGLAFPEKSIPEVEERMAGLAQGYFGSSTLSKETEFHAKEIVDHFSIRPCIRAKPMQRSVAKIGDIFPKLIMPLNVCDFIRFLHCIIEI
jgi:hypothetical protein